MKKGNTRSTAGWAMVAITLMGFGGSASAVETGQVQGTARLAAAVTAGGDTEIGSDWVVKSEDNICGVSTAHQITNPAKVDYEKLMEVTSEMKELKREGIKRDSARGQALVTKARDKVLTATKTVMSEKGHCSVWKKISHKKSQAVTDLTSAIQAKLEA